jgi:hypothetical protein
MKRIARSQNELFTILARGEKIVKQPLYKAVTASTDYRQWANSKRKESEQSTVEFLRKIGCNVKSYSSI